MKIQVNDKNFMTAEKLLAVPMPNELLLEQPYFKPAATNLGFGNKVAPKVVPRSQLLSNDCYNDIVTEEEVRDSGNPNRHIKRRNKRRMRYESFFDGLQKEDTPTVTQEEVIEQQTEESGYQGIIDDFETIEDNFQQPQH